MPLNLRILFLGHVSDPKELPPVHDETIQVAGFAEASKACLERIKANGVIRDQWAGGIVTDDQGRELAQVSYNGLVFEDRPHAQNRYIAVHIPTGVASRWIEEPAKVEPLRLDIPGHGACLITRDRNDQSATRLHLASEPGFQVDGKAADYFETKFDIVPEGIAIFRNSAIYKLAGDGDDDAPEALLDTTQEAITDWLRDPENAASLTAMVERLAIDVLDWERSMLSNSDRDHEEERRNLLAHVIQIAAFREGIETLKAQAAPKP